MLRSCLLIACLFAVSACSQTKDYSRGEETRRPSPTDNIDSRPSNAEAAKVNIQLGQAYLSQGKLDLAMDKLKRGVELAPQNPDGHTVIAVLYEQLGNMDRAGKHYREARRLAPDSGLAANNLGRFLCGQGQFEQADKLFAEAVTDPFYKTPESAYLNRGSCAMSAGRVDAASEYLRIALDASPNMPDALFQSAALAMVRKDPMRARAFIERYFSVAPASAPALAFAIRIEEALKDQRAVSRYRDRLIQEFPESAEADALGRTMGSR